MKKIVTTGKSKKDMKRKEGERNTRQKKEGRSYIAGGEASLPPSSYTSVLEEAFVCRKTFSL